MPRRDTLTTVYKVFRLIQLLSSTPYLKVPQLAERLDCADRTLYDYLKLLDRLGFEPDKDANDRYFLPVDRERTATGALDVDGARYLQEVHWQMPDDDERRNIQPLRPARVTSRLPIGGSEPEYEIYNRSNSHL